MNIVLIGFMGCGKSTVAEKLGELLDREVVETDGLIELEQGKSIADALYLSRLPLYRKAADITVSGKQSLQEIVGEIARKIGRGE